MSVSHMVSLNEIFIIFTYQILDSWMKYNKEKKEGKMQQIDWQDFLKVELRVGKIVQAEVFEQARKPAYILHVDFGEELGIK